MNYFDHCKAREVVLYVISRIPNPGFHNLSKVLYFADRKHLHEFGRFICGDHYIAMQHGPVPSGVYDMVKAIRDGSEWHRGYQATQEVLEVFDNYRLRPLRDASPEHLSDSERNCLENSIAEYGSLSFGQLTALSHDEAYESADFNDEINIEVVARTLQGGDEIVEHLRNPYPGSA